MKGPERKVVVVTRRTRLDDLVARFHTLAQARFYIEHLGADFGEYLREHETYQAARRTLMEQLAGHGRTQSIERSMLPTFLFGPHDIVLALGQDGLVANIMKYLDGQPLIGVNPDPQRNDGVLLPFRVHDCGKILHDVLEKKRPCQRVTMAQATLSDGQKLYAVNDFFIGPRSHTSARYEITVGKASEAQSSSGVIVSTGLGSTGWMRSIVTGSLAVASANTHTAPQKAAAPIPWDADYLTYAVREPFPSRTSAASLVFGQVSARQPLKLQSLMPENGVIFSDGIESDFLQFNSGTTALIGVAIRVGQLVI